MEWTVVTVLIAVAGLALTVGTPIVRLNQSITTLNVTLQHLQKQMDEQKQELAAHEASSHESHRRIWEHNDKQDERLNDHEQRITLLEHKED